MNQSDSQNTNNKSLSSDSERYATEDTVAGDANSNNSVDSSTPKRPEPYFQSSRKYFTICVYALGLVTLCTIIIYLIVNGQQTRAGITKLTHALAPFFFALFIAFLLNPVLNFFYQKIFGKLFRQHWHALRISLSILFTYLFALGIITITVLYIIPHAGESLADLTATIPALTEQLLDFLNNLEIYFPDLDIEWVEEKLQEIIPNLINFGTTFISNLVPLLYSFSVSFAKLVINLLLSIVISCYMLIDKSILTRRCKRLAYAFLPEDKVQEFITTCKECIAIFTGFINGKTLDSFIIGILCFVLMSIFKMPYALLLSVIVGITNMIPYFGPFIGAIPGVLIYIFISPLQALGFAILILALQQFDGLYLGPKILGSSTGLKPLWVIFAITIGGAYGGVLGMFLGVPTIGVFAHLINKLVDKQLAKKNIPDDF